MDAVSFLCKTRCQHPQQRRGRFCANMFETVKRTHRFPHTVRLGALFMYVHTYMGVYGRTHSPAPRENCAPSSSSCSDLSARSSLSPRPPPPPLAFFQVSWPLPGPDTSLPRSLSWAPWASDCVVRPVFHAELILFEQVAAVTSRGIGNWSDSKSITTTRGKGTWFQDGRFREESDLQRQLRVPGKEGWIREHHTAFPPAWARAQVHPG